MAEVGVYQKDCRRTAGKRGGEVDRGDGLSLMRHWAGYEEALQSSLFPSLQEPLAQNPETLVRCGRELPRSKNALLRSRPARNLLCTLDDLRPRMDSRGQFPPLFPRLSGLLNSLLRIVQVAESSEYSRPRTSVRARSRRRLKCLCARVFEPRRPRFEGGEQVRQLSVVARGWSRRPCSACLLGLAHRL